MTYSRVTYRYCLYSISYCYKYLHSINRRCLNRNVTTKALPFPLFLPPLSLSSLSAFLILSLLSSSSLSFSGPLRYTHHYHHHHFIPISGLLGPLKVSISATSQPGFDQPSASCMSGTGRRRHRNRDASVDSVLVLVVRLLRGGAAFKFEQLDVGTGVV